MSDETELSGNHLDAVNATEKERRLAEDDEAYNILLKRVTSHKGRNKVTPELKAECLKTLQKHRIMNTMEVCRSINGLDWKDFHVCSAGQKFGVTRRSFGDSTRCNWVSLGCQTDYWAVNGALRWLAKKELIHTKKMRFWEKTLTFSSRCAIFLFREGESL